jgi:DNA-binding response OmpR family regulator
MANKILIVDDDPMLSELISYNLESEGYAIVRAGDGWEGLRLFREEEPDLVILDVSMPKLNGWEVCERIRATSDTPVMMLTAQGREEDVIRGLDLGADDYLTKPFQVRILLARIRAALRRAKLSPTQTPGVSYA